MKTIRNFLIISVSLSFLLLPSLIKAQTCEQNCMSFCDKFTHIGKALSSIIDELVYEPLVPGGPIANILQPLEQVIANCGQNPSSYCQNNCLSSQEYSIRRNPSIPMKMPRNS